MDLWNYFLRKNFHRYLDALIHPITTIKYIKNYSNEFNQRVKRISLLLDVNVEKVNSIIQELNEDEFYFSIKKELDNYSNLKLGDNLNPLGAPTLYILARIFKPKVLVETGVASGVSSSFILNALSKNNQGKLYSIDLPNAEIVTSLIPEGKESGWIIPDNLRDRHELIIGDSKKELPKILDKLGTIDWFFHDSLHTYDFMTWEYNQAWGYLSSPGLLLSDDITWNSSFKDFSKKVKAKNWATFYNLGVIKKS